MPDHRLDELKECELCDAGDVTVRTQPQPSSCGSAIPGTSPEQGGVDEALVRRITDLIMEKLNA